MKRLRGKNKGQYLKPIQYCNDWILCDDGERTNMAVRPTAVRLDPEDFALFEDPSVQSGSFWQEWELGADGLFIALKRGTR